MPNKLIAGKEVPALSAAGAEKHFWRRAKIIKNSLQLYMIVQPAEKPDH